MSELKKLKRWVWHISKVTVHLHSQILKLEQAVEELKEKLNPSEAKSIWFYVEIDGKLTKVEKMDSTMVLKKLTVVPVDAAGKPAKIDGLPAWSLSDDSMATLAVAEDGFTGSLMPKEGAAFDVPFTLLVEGDADLTPAEKKISGSLEITWKQGEAVGFLISIADA